MKESQKDFKQPNRFLPRTSFQVDVEREEYEINGKRFVSLDDLTLAFIIAIYGQVFSYICRNFEEIITFFDKPLFYTGDGCSLCVPRTIQEAIGDVSRIDNALRLAATHAQKECMNPFGLVA